jgi:hypothetical protein
MKASIRGHCLTYRLASDKGIASVSMRASAYGVVIDDSAFRAYAASAGTGVSTFLIATSFVLGTLGADNAFGATGGRASYVSWYARAHRLTVDLPTLTVGAAG